VAPDNDSSFITVLTMASPPESPPAFDGSPILADKVNKSRTHRDVSKVKRLSTVVEKTVDRLSRSVGGTAPSPTSSQARRVFSLSRKKLSVPESIGRCQNDLRR
jgi:hypothetical protein